VEVAQDWSAMEWSLWYIRLAIDCKNNLPTPMKIDLPGPPQLRTRTAYAAWVQQVLEKLPPDDQAVFEDVDLRNADKLFQECQCLSVAWYGVLLATVHMLQQLTKC
jgi:hypothetical protein